MKIDVRMSNEDYFEVNHWHASAPDYVVYALRQQLAAATSVWPELKKYRLVELKPKPEAA